MRMTRGGFTLTEVLITVIIIGILATAALANYGSAVGRARYDTACAVLQQIYEGEWRYNAQFNVFVARDAASTLVQWRDALNMDKPTGTVVAYNAAITAPGFNANATSGGFTLTLSQDHAVSGTWLRPGGGTCNSF